MRCDGQLLAAIASERTNCALITEISGLKVDGNKLMAVGIPQKSLGKILSALLLEVIKDPSLNTEEDLICSAKTLYEKGE